MNSITWLETVKLGKDTVGEKLDSYGITYDRATNYFKLCSLLYQHIKSELIAQETIAQESCVGVMVEPAVYVEKEWTVDKMRDYRAKYHGMRNYINNWFDRVKMGKISVPDGILTNAIKMWDYHKQIDKYRNIKIVYDYLYRFDYPSRSNLTFNTMSSVRKP